MPEDDDLQGPPENPETTIFSMPRQRERRRLRSGEDDSTIRIIRLIRKDEDGIEYLIRFPGRRVERILIALPRRSELLDRMRDENPGATPEELLSKVRQFLAQYVRAEILKVHRQRSKVDAEISDLGVI